MALFLSLSLLLLLLLPHSVSAQCSDLFACGSLGDIGFPFADTISDDNPDCKASPFILNCSDYFNPQLQFSKQNKVYSVQAMNYSRRMIVVRDSELESQLNSNRCASLANFTHIPTSPLVQFKDVSEELTFLKCKRKQEVGLVVLLQSLRNYSGCVDGYDLYFNADGTASFPTLPASLLDKCEVIRLPVSQLPSSSSNAGGQGLAEAEAGSWASAKGNNASAKSGSWASAESRPGQNGNPVVNSGVTRLSSLLKAEFSLGWEVLPTCSQCQQRGGTCSEDGSGKFQCRRGKGVATERHGNARRRKAIAIDVSIAASAFILLLLLIWYCWSSKRRNSARTQDAQLFEDYLQTHQSLSLKRYSFAEIKRMTKSFHDKLGQGGYGAVFKGKLSDDGRLVAVKVLTESKGNNVQEFINEVGSIGKTCHVNIVTLVGFCCERLKRALVYEFMPNGSLDKFIYLDPPIAVPPQLGNIIHDCSWHCKGTRVLASRLQHANCPLRHKTAQYSLRPQLRTEDI
ncbi:hypothetical protein Syun_021836 [Stephania yunnanensis]|uniref:Protein kinase domain-containing protein n=1 Tax=Stephania yunnanensis TaxID=152371 RepID=A0AAP0IGC4_9MAGN